MLPVGLRYRAVWQHRSQDGWGKDLYRGCPLAPTVQVCHYGPLPISPLVYVVASSLTVAFWSTVAPESS